MGPLETTIAEKINRQFNSEVLQVTNQSYMHSVPAGSESHFKVVVVSDQFDGKRLVQRHQAICAVLAYKLKGPMHALAVHTYLGSEWSENQGGAPDFLNCLGGSKTG